jgi:Mg/Co/Ni transporter MgtE
LDGTGLIELDERTNELVEAGLQKALQGVPEDVRPEILKLMESDRERIHETMKQAAIQQMMSEAQNREILDSLNLERHNERE